MTVKQLLEKLSKIDENTRVVVYTEHASDLDIFEIEDVSVGTGTPGRLEDGKAVFGFDRKGPASWLFIQVVPA
jgi:hypothetical protein